MLSVLWERALSHGRCPGVPKIQRGEPRKDFPTIGSHSYGWWETSPGINLRRAVRLPYSKQSATFTIEKETSKTGRLAPLLLCNSLEMLRGRFQAEHLIFFRISRVTLRTSNSS